MSCRVTSPMLYHHSNGSNGEKGYFNYLFIHFVHLLNCIYLFTQASKFGVKRKKHQKPGQNRERTGPAAGPVIFRFCPEFQCFFLQHTPPTLAKGQTTCVRLPATLRPSWEDWQDQKCPLPIVRFLCVPPGGGAGPNHLKRDSL